MITLPVITIRQPWAWLILQQQNIEARKDIENRNWKLPTKYINNPVLVHTSSSAQIMWDVWASQELIARGFYQFGLSSNPGRPEISRLTGNIVGCVVFSGCTENVIGENEMSPWCDEDSKFWWHIKEAYPVTPVPAKGKLSFWKFDYPYADQIRM